MNTLYQVQLETSEHIYCFEIATDEYDAVEWAEVYLAEYHEDYGPFHIGGHCSIGYTQEKGVLSFRESEDL